MTIAAVQGHAIGAGFQLALACDFRVLAEDVQFCMAETGLGLVPDLGGTLPLVRLVGYSRAAEICVTSRRVARGRGAADRPRELRRARGPSWTTPSTSWSLPVLKPSRRVRSRRRWR